MHTRKHGLIRVAGVSSFVVLLMLSCLFLNPTILTPTSDGSVHATSTSGTPVSSIVVLNMSLTHPNASVELTPHDADGTFASSSASSSAEFDVSTNNYTGYTLSLASSTNNDGSLTNTDTNITTNNTLSSISTITTEPDFSNPSSTNLNNKWGYKPSKYNGNDNTSYIPAPSITNPSTNSAILDTTSTYNTTTGGEAITTETSTEDINANTYTIGLGARVDYTVATGSYENTFILQAVGNPVPVTLSYTDTSGDASVTSTLPSSYNGEVTDVQVPISTTIPTRTGYTFKSWCLGTVMAGTSNTSYVDTCTGTTYSASNPTDGTQYIGVDLTQGSAIILVAMWERSTVTVTLTPGTGVSSVAVTGADVKSGSGTASAIVYYGGNVTITATMSNGYAFVNWTGSATYTNREQSISNVTSNLSLTANGHYATINDITYMQDIAKMTSAGKQALLSSMVEDQQYQLRDNRDNNTYYVAKLKDGNIWMTQNLDLCIGCTGTASLTSENTDLNQYDTKGNGTGTTFSGYSVKNGVITWTPVGSTMTGTPASITNFAPETPLNPNAATSVPSWNNSYTAPYMAEGSTTVSYGTGTYTTLYTNVAACVSAGNSEALCKHNQYGNYYNWSASVAMNDTSMYTSKYTVAPNSICPAGWRLPKGLTQAGTVSEFNSLLNAYGIAGGNDTNGNANVGYATGGFIKLIGAPLFYARAGDIDGTVLYYSTEHGNYWWSSVSSNANAFYLAFHSTGMYPVYQNNRGHGRTLRCLSK